MSTGLECEFFTVIKDNITSWYYLLEDWSAPKNAWDWREYATAYGPFETYEKADQHLIDNHANPGGQAIEETPVAWETLEDFLKEELEAAPARLKSHKTGWL